MDIRILSEEEIKEMALHDGETYALYDKQKKSVFITYTELDPCLSDLKHMGPRHPRYQHMEVVMQWMPGDECPTCKCKTIYGCEHDKCPIPKQAK